MPRSAVGCRATIIEPEKRRTPEHLDGARGFGVRVFVFELRPARRLRGQAFKPARQKFTVDATDTGDLIGVLHFALIHQGFHGPDKLKRTPDADILKVCHN